MSYWILCGGVCLYSCLFFLDSFKDFKNSLKGKQAIYRRYKYLHNESLRIINQIKTF